MKKLLIITLLGSSVGLRATTYSRLTKNEKENFISLIAEPMRKIEQKIDTINQAANAIQNFIIDNYNQPVDSELKEQYHQILIKLSHLSLLVEALAYVVQAQTQITQDLVNHVNDLENTVAGIDAQLQTLQATIGSLTDVSVGEQEFNSVQDIDDAQLSVISWLKTVYREQLASKFIS